MAEWLPKTQRGWGNFHKCQMENICEITIGALFLTLQERQIFQQSQSYYLLLCIPGISTSVEKMPDMVAVL